MIRSILLSFLLLISVCLKAQTTLTINTASGGTLQSEFTSHSYDPTAVITLTITGILDARDFRYMRDNLTALSVLDISGTSIVSYTGTLGPMAGLNMTYPANELPYSAFFNSSTHVGKGSITSIVLPNTITTIGQHALQYCNVLSSVTIPPSVVTIKPWAFRCDTVLLNTYVPAGVDSIQSGAFQQAGGVVVDAGNPYYSSLDGVLFNKNKSILITCPFTKYSYTIPASVDTLLSESFGYCAHLSSLSIPNTVEFIYSRAFIGSGLVSVTIPSSITKISDQTFFICRNLITVNLPNSITEIGFGAFYGCVSLPSIDIPSSVDSIQPMCFYADSGLISVTLHQGLKSIGYSVFQKCTHLASILLPASVNYIGSTAFYNCKSLSSIYAGTTIPIDLSASPGVFTGVDTNTCTLYVPLGSLSLYESADQWKDFNIMVEYDIGIDPATAECFKVFVENCNLNIWDIPYGETVSICTLQGTQILNQKMFSDRLTFRLPCNGMYIVKIGRKTGKIIAI